MKVEIHILRSALQIVDFIKAISVSGFFEYFKKIDLNKVNLENKDL